MKLVFIHGRGQQGKDPVELKATWEEAFEQGLENAGLKRPPSVRIDLPFYGDTLDQLVRELDTPSITEVAERGAQWDDDEATFHREFLEELARGAGLSDDVISRYWQGEVQERGLLNQGWVHAFLQALDNSRELGDLALDTFTRDVYVYLRKPVVQRRIDSIVVPHISDTPCVVVGHSLGSIVGYNVLRATSHPVVRYVTVGSPLGVKAVKNRLRPPLGMPKSISSWFNAMDDRDVVALNPLNGEHFPTNPPIVNKTNVQNSTSNQHGIVGYLPDPDVARSIYEALTGKGS